MSLPVPEDPAAVAAWLAGQEAAVPNLRPGAAKQILWAGQAGQVTPLSVVYVHGFSASLQETRPLPDHVALALGANLHFGRLSGHGRDGPAMAEATAASWLASVVQALDVGRVLGRQVLVIACSTGAPLVAMALRDRPHHVAGLVQISPNWQLKNWLPRMMLGLPGLSVWGPQVLTKDRGFIPRNDDHGRHWTTQYPMRTIIALRDTLDQARALDLSRIQVPTLILAHPDDAVVDPVETRRRMADWGGPVTEKTVPLGPGDDENRHVIAGDILSPGGTAPAQAAILKWVAGLAVGSAP